MTLVTEYLFFFIVRKGDLQFMYYTTPRFGFGWFIQVFFIRWILRVFFLTIQNVWVVLELMVVFVIFSSLIFRTFPKIFRVLEKKNNRCFLFFSFKRFGPFFFFSLLKHSRFLYNLLIFFSIVHRLFFFKSPPSRWICFVLCLVFNSFPFNFSFLTLFRLMFCFSLFFLFYLRFSCFSCFASPFFLVFVLFNYFFSFLLFSLFVFVLFLPSPAVLRAMRPASVTRSKASPSSRCVVTLSTNYYYNTY